MKTLTHMLSSIDLELQDLLLDPNNPRFSELGEESKIIPEPRYAEEKIQSITFDRMKSHTFNVSELKDTIKAVGFLPMDRIVVRRWKSNTLGSRQKYVVIEGNRRVTALKWLLQLHDAGKETLDEEQINNYSNLNCLLLGDEFVNDSAILILPGLRHVSGIKEWGAYQKAKTIYELRNSGLTAQEAAQSLGLSTRASNQAYRCFLALEAMKANEEYGEFAEPKMYSYFEEIFKKPDVKTWLNWNELSNEFENSAGIMRFYSWMVPNNEEGDSDATPKLPEAKSVRDLSQIINDEEAMAVFEAPNGTLVRALARYEAEHPEDWYPKILAALSAVKSLTPAMLRSMDVDSEKKLNDLSAAITLCISDRQLLSSK
jgi:hypothetical protein